MLFSGDVRRQPHVRLTMFLKPVVTLKKALKTCCSITRTTAALWKRQASLTSALSRCHFPSSGDVDQSSNRGSCNYYFSWSQNCWAGSDLSSVLWLLHRGVGGNRLGTCSAAGVAGSVLPWWEQSGAGTCPLGDQTAGGRGGQHPWAARQDDASGKASSREVQR